MKALLDANVLVALLDSDHQNHQAVKQWFVPFINQVGNYWLTCNITQLACLRILSLPSYPNSYHLTDIQTALQQAMKHSHINIINEIDIINQQHLEWQHIQGHRQLTDCYLLALAKANNAVFVTLDTKINLKTVKNATSEDLLIL